MAEDTLTQNIQKTYKTPKVKNAVLEYPQGGKGFFDFGKYPDGTSPQHGSCRLALDMSDGSKEYMEYYSDEISIQPYEVLHKTLKECWKIYFDKDKRYLQS